MTHGVRLGIFERPGADFVLRRTLGELLGGTRARACMATFSRFVVLVPWHGRPEGYYIRCETIQGVFTVIGQAWFALERAGASDVFIDRAVEPETERLIDEAAAKMEELARPPAANDP